MAGQIGEIARDTLRRDYPRSTRRPRIVLAEAADRILGSFPPKLSAKAAQSLKELGVTVMTDHAVVGLDGEAGDDEGPGHAEVVVPTRTTIWAAGVTASPLAQMLADAAHAETDRAGRLLVQPD